MIRTRRARPKAAHQARALAAFKSTRAVAIPRAARWAKAELLQTTKARSAATENSKRPRPATTAMARPATAATATVKSKPTTSVPSRASPANESRPNRGRSPPFWSQRTWSGFNRRTRIGGKHGEDFRSRGAELRGRRGSAQDGKYNSRLHSQKTSCDSAGVEELIASRPSHTAATD